MQVMSQVTIVAVYLWNRFGGRIVSLRSRSIRSITGLRLATLGKGREIRAGAALARPTASFPEAGTSSIAVKY
jgi:hypothetical protein